MEVKPITNPIKAIRAKCFDCTGGMVSEITNCPINSCALHPFRSGSNPFRKKRELSDEQRESMKLRLEAARNAKNAA